MLNWHVLLSVSDVPNEMGHIRDSNADQNQPLHRLSWNVRNSGCEEASAAREIQHVATDLF